LAQFLGSLLGPQFGMSINRYDHRNRVDKMREYFATFDGGDKGYVTLEDLRQVWDEVGEAESKMTDVAVGSAGGGNGDVVNGDAALGAMIEHFDDDRDGVIGYLEFGNVLGPLLFPSPSTL
jgi:Ca2+-binding EF-hand superfamily protein